MMPCKYRGIDGVERILDLDSVIDIAKFPSKKKKGWEALIVYDPVSKSFVELRDSPPDIRGNSKDEAEEVTVKYLADALKVGEIKIMQIKSDPSRWRFTEI